MALAGYLYKDWTQGASVTGTATVAGLGFDKLQDPQPRHRARVSNDSCRIIIDIGSVQSVDVAALISTSLDGTATARLRMSATDPNVTSNVLYNSGFVANVTDARFNGAIVGALSTPVSVQYIRWDLTGTAPIDVGLAPCGLLFRPRSNFIYGAQEGRLDGSTRDRNPDTGAEFAVARPTARVKFISHDFLSAEDVRTDFDVMDYSVGAAGDLLYVEDSDADWLSQGARFDLGFVPHGEQRLRRRASATHLQRHLRPQLPADGTVVTLEDGECYRTPMPGLRPRRPETCRLRLPRP
jgi:hypothetical protein